MRPTPFRVPVALSAGLFGLLACMATAYGEVTAPPANAPTTMYPANTRPSDRRLLSLDMAHLVRTVSVKPGDKVTKGSVLIAQDDREELINEQITQKMEEEAKCSIAAAKVTRDSKRLELDRMKAMGAAASPSELERAKLEFDLSVLEIDAKESQYLQKQLQSQRQAVTVQRMRIMAPFDGIIEELNLREGEVVDPTKPALIIVQNNPLWVDVYLPTSIAMWLKDNQVQELDVTCAGLTPRKGKIIYYSPVADAAADVQFLRLEMPNPEGRPSGLQGQVTVPKAAVETVKTATPTSAAPLSVPAK